jgi:hypothetical protein
LFVLNKKGGNIIIPRTHILSNSLGSFYYWSEQPYAKFSGLIFREDSELIKCLEKIEIKESKYLDSSDTEKEIIVKREDVDEKYYLQKDKNCFSYNLDKKKDITLYFDIHKMNDFDEWGRLYSIIYEKGCVILEYKKEDNNKRQQYLFYVAIKINDKKDSVEDIEQKEIGSKYNKIEQFVRVEYEYDKFRNSSFERYVYKAINFESNFFTLSFSSKKNIAIKNAIDLFNNIEEIKQKDNRKTKVKNLNFNDKLITEAFENVSKSMDKLIFSNKKEKFSGIYAGYPWFFQTWARDELICINYLIENREFLKVKNIFNKYFANKSKFVGNLPAIIPDQGNKSADGLGWLAFRFQSFIKKLKSENKLNKFYTKEDLENISKYFEHHVEVLKKEYFRNGLVYSGKNETWMDTDFDDNGREGFCIEIQALTINLFEFLSEISGKDEYYRDAKELRSRTIECFFINDNLVDYLDVDFNAVLLVRPNLFIANYIYPSLLAKEQWEEVFDKTLNSLWLNWGGLSSLEKNSNKFIDEYTGENNMSYHRGDSWYFLNFLTAICLSKCNYAKYKEYIEKIINSGINECLNNGVYGAIAEVSSAKELTGYGCLSQAWSNALFVELLKIVDLERNIL